ncbi:MAG: FAD-binding and (Fe-S)-binding domain-containing protein [Promethearchaeota archaeon]
MSYDNISEDLKDQLKGIVGARYYFDEIEIRWTYAFGGTIFNNNWIPELILLPQNAQQVSLILQIASENNIPITPRGNGTSLSAGTMTPYGGIVLDLSQMNRILSLSVENNMVVVEPGVICDDLNHLLNQDGYFFPPDPGSSSVASIGGMVASNAGGVQAFKYGVTKHYVLFLEVVLPDGTIVTFGSKTIKSVSSYNFTDLFVGSEGTLGVITKIGLKIRPLPRKRKLGLFIFEKIEQVGETALKLRREAILPSILEFMDSFVVNAIKDHLGSTIGEMPLGHALLAEMDGETKRDINDSFEKLLTAVLQQEPIFYKVAETEEERAKLIQVRKSSLPALSRIASSSCVEDCSIQITDFVSVVKKIWNIPKDINADYLKVCVASHMEGNLHPRFLFNENDETQVQEFEKAIKHLYEKIVLPVGGSLTGEHGIGKVKTPYLELEHGRYVVSLMEKIKLLFDPKRILNPGSGKGSLTKLHPIRSIRKLKNIDNTILRLNCMRCGFCNATCPSRVVNMVEAYSPRGRLSILNGLIHGDLVLSDLIVQILHECTLCGHCAVICPSGVETHRIFEKAREIIHYNKKV